MSRQANPLAAYLDAATDAHHAGVPDCDVAFLQEIGEDLASFSEALSVKLARLSDGRMVTRHDGRSDTRRAETFTTDDLLDGMIEGAIGHLDAIAVVRSAAALLLSRPAPFAKAA